MNTVVVQPKYLAVVSFVFWDDDESKNYHECPTMTYDGAKHFRENAPTHDRWLEWSMHPCSMLCITEWHFFMVIRTEQMKKAYEKELKIYQETEDNYCKWRFEPYESPDKWTHWEVKGRIYTYYWEPATIVDVGVKLQYDPTLTKST